MPEAKSRPQMEMSLTGAAANVDMRTSSFTCLPTFPSGGMKSHLSRRQQTRRRRKKSRKRNTYRISPITVAPVSQSIKPTSRSRSVSLISDPITPTLICEGGQQTQSQTPATATAVDKMAAPSSKAALLTPSINQIIPTNPWQQIPEMSPHITKSTVVAKPVPMRDNQENMSEHLKTAAIMQSLMTQSRSNVKSDCLARQMHHQNARVPNPSASFMPVHPIASASASLADDASSQVHPSNMMFAAPLRGDLQPQPTSRSGYPHASAGIGNQHNHHLNGAAPCTTERILDPLMREIYQRRGYQYHRANGYPKYLADSGASAAAALADFQSYVPTPGYVGSRAYARQLHLVCEDEMLLRMRFARYMRMDIDNPLFCLNGPRRESIRRGGLAYQRYAEASNQQTHCTRQDNQPDVVGTVVRYKRKSQNHSGSVCKRFRDGER